MPSSISAGSSDIAANWSPADHPWVRIRSRLTWSELNCIPCRSNSCGRFPLVEGEIEGTDLGELATDPQAMQPQWRIGSTQDDEPHRGRQMVDQLTERFQHRVTGDLVEVVEHHDHRAGEFGQPDPDLPRLLIGEPRPGNDVMQTALRRHGTRPHHRAEQIRPERLWVVVGGVKTHPGDGAGRRAVGGPGGNSQRLARARTGTDQGELLRRALGQPIFQAAPTDQTRRNDRGLGLEHGQRLQTLGHRANPSTFGPDGCRMVGCRIQMTGLPLAGSQQGTSRTQALRHGRADFSGESPESHTRWGDYPGGVTRRRRRTARVTARPRRLCAGATKEMSR